MVARRARKRILYDGCYAHVFSRSIDKRYIFREEKDFKEFSGYLLEAKEKYAFQIHHYCLMHTHFHLAVSIPNLESFSKALHRVKWAYTRSFNLRYKRRGTLWQERFKSMLIEDPKYLHACGLYIENNPVEVGLVKKSGEWEYSSARTYQEGPKSPLVDAYELPALPEKIDLQNKDFFTKGEGIGSNVFKIYQRDEQESWIPVP